MASIKEIKEKLKNTDSTKIFFTNLNGRLMSLPVNPDDIDTIIEKGVGFDGSSIAGMATVDNSDRLLFPDPESFCIVEFEDDKTGFFIGHIYSGPDGGRPLVFTRFLQKTPHRQKRPDHLGDFIDPL